MQLRSENKLIDSLTTLENSLNKLEGGLIMKTIQGMIVLFAIVFLAMLGCSDQLQSPIAPAEQSSLDKVIITEYTFTNTPEPFTANPYDFMNIAGRTLHLKIIL